MLSCLCRRWLGAGQRRKQIIMLHMLPSFGMNGVIAGQYTYTAEIYPPRSGTGMARHRLLARIVVIVSPTIVGRVAYPGAGFQAFAMTTAI